MEIFSDIIKYEFLRNALFAGVLASFICGIIGSYIVVRRLVFISGGVSHSAFGGIGLGYYLGFNPIYGAILFSIFSGAFIGLSKRYGRQTEDTAIGVMWAAGMALGILFISLSPGYAPDLLSYLFGNILTVPAADIYLMLILCFVVSLVVVLLHKDLVAVSFDEDYAKIKGRPVDFIYFLMLTLICVSIVFLIKMVGIILVISLMTIPAAISVRISKKFKTMIIYSILFGFFFTIVGLFLSYKYDLQSGATIILVAVCAYIISFLPPFMKRLLKSRPLYFLLIASIVFVSLDLFANQKINVSVTILPQKKFVEDIGGDRVNVSVIIPGGANPHSFEPKPSDLKKFSKAAVYVKVGTPIEFEVSWVKKLLEISKKVKVIDMSKGVNFLTDSDHDGHGHLGNSGINPHIWLSLKELKKQLENIYEGLSSIDRSSQKYFKSNLNERIVWLNKFEKEAKEILTKVKNRRFISIHPFLSYLARDINFVELTMRSHGVEPKAKRMKKLIEIVQNEGISTIFVPEQFSKGEAQTISKQTGAKVITVNPMAQDVLKEIRRIVVSLSGS